MSRLTTRLTLLFVASSALVVCATVPPPPPKPKIDHEKEMLKVEVEAKTRKLMETNDRLNGLRNDLDGQRRRLQNICVDYPDHQACDIHAAAEFARNEFCGDPEFTSHVDEVVSACHTGQCKQVDEANLLERTNYMRLVQRLPHSLVLFRAYDTKLDKRDRRQLQAFIEQIQANRGYLIIVGRASRDGSWKQNLRLALDRAEETRRYIVEDLGFDASRAGYITYGHEKMYITDLDADRLTEKKVSTKQANRSALVFAYPCFDGELPAEPAFDAPAPSPPPAPASTGGVDPVDELFQ